jgi:outer membrane protein
MPARPYPALCFGALLVLAACAPALPGVGGSAPTPSTRWTPPADRLPTGASETTPLPASDKPLTAEELVTLALERSPESRVTWANARAAAANLGVAKADIFPDLTANLNTNRLKTSATGGRVSVEQTTYGPSLSLTWLLFDFGGRAGAIGAARDALFAADWTHNAMLADIVRRTAQGYYAYVGARSLLEAQRLTLQQAEVNLAAAEDRRRVGVATISDVLQARTAVGQARLAMQDAEGAEASTHGALATLVGLPPTTAFGVDTTAASAPITDLSDAVDSLIVQALAERPDLAAARAQVDARRDQARVVRSRMLPSFNATGSGSRTYVSGVSGGKDSYNFGVGVSVPIFNGFGWQYAAQAANLLVEAEAARVRSLEQQVSLQVFLTYQQLRTARTRVATADDLFASASEAADASRARYREGVGSLLELLNAEQALANARAQRVQARVEWHTSLVQLAHDAGLLEPNGGTRLHVAPSRLPAPGSNR